MGRERQDGSHRGDRGGRAARAVGLARAGETRARPTRGQREPESERGGGQTTKVDSSRRAAGMVHAQVGDTARRDAAQQLQHRLPVEGRRAWSEAAVLKQVGEPKIVAPKSDLAGRARQDPVHVRGRWKRAPRSSASGTCRPPRAAAGAAYALIVKVGTGHVPVDVNAGEEYTAETAEMRTGDTLVVTIKHASDQGRHAWKMIGGSPYLKLVSQKYSAAARRR